MRQTYLHAHRRECTRGGLGPLDEADRALEVGLEVAPLGRRKALEAVEIEVRDVGVVRVPVKVGLVTGAVIPSARQAPRTNVVLPLPRSPLTVTTSPARSSPASAAPAASVSAGEAESISMTSA